MWTKLIDLVKTRWYESPTPDQNLAKAIITLYGSVHNCHIAFQDFEKDQSEQNFANFAFAIDGMISTLKNLHPTLKIFDSERAHRLNSYAMSSDRIATMNQPKELVKSQIRFLRELIHEESDNVELPDEHFKAFMGAKNQMSTFILTNFTLPDIFGQP
jgi:hypothetical protein